MPELLDDLVLETMLTRVGCPYPQGSVDAVVWLSGYRAGAAQLERLRALFERLGVLTDRLRDEVGREGDRLQ